MDNRLLLVKTIVLIYRESQRVERTDNSAELAHQVLKEVQLPAVIIGASAEKELIKGLKATLNDMANQPPTHSFERTSLLLNLRENCKEDDTLFGFLEEAIKQELTDQEIVLNCIELQQSIRDFFRNKELQKLLYEYSSTFSKETVRNPRQVITELMSKLEPHTNSGGKADPAIISAVNMLRPDEVRSIYSRVQAIESEDQVLMTGWQGVNRMLDGGFRPGEMGVINAMEHNYKSGFVTDLFSQIAMYNDAKCIRDATKKPALVYISMEDTAEMKFQFLYKVIRENETGQLIDGEEGVTADMRAKYVQEAMSSRGWACFILEVNPLLWTYNDISNKILEIEAAGYEVRLTVADYLYKVPTTGCTQGPSGVDVRNLFERVKAFFNARRITFLTPHQLSPDAKVKQREGSSNFVDEVAGKGFYAGTKQLGQVIDLDIYINIEKYKDEAYLTIKRGKHRKVKQTPMEYLYVVLKFMKGGIIPRDVGKPDSTRLKVGGDTIAEAMGAELGDDF